MPTQPSSRLERAELTEATGAEPCPGTPMSGRARGCRTRAGEGGKGQGAHRLARRRGALLANRRGDGATCDPSTRLEGGTRGGQRPAGRRKAGHGPGRCGGRRQSERLAGSVDRERERERESEVGRTHRRSATCEQPGEGGCARGARAQNRGTGLERRGRASRRRPATGGLCAWAGASGRLRRWRGRVVELAGDEARVPRDGFCASAWRFSEGYAAATV